MIFFKVSDKEEVLLEAREENMAITLVSLPSDINLVNQKQRSTLMMSLDRKEFFPICTLVPFKLEQCSLNLKIPSNTSASLIVEGPNELAVVLEIEGNQEYDVSLAGCAKAAEEEIPKSKKRKEKQEKQEIQKTKKLRCASTAGPNPERIDSNEKKKKKAKEVYIDHPSGIKICVLKTADAPSDVVACLGDEISVFYIGRVQGEVEAFEVHCKAPCFTFHLGSQDVISGWNHGIVGMNIGERRKLVVPPKLAYGPEGCLPKIPPDATLEFDIFLISINGKGQE